MKARTIFGARSLLAAAIVALAPTGAALADPNCEGDPFAPYFKSFFADGQYRCREAAPSQAGAQGPSGPVMEAPEPERSRTNERATADRALPAEDDPFAPYRRVFIGD